MAPGSRASVRPYLGYATCLAFISSMRRGHDQPSVDPVLFVGLGLLAGGLSFVASFEVLAAGGLIVALALWSRRAGRGQALAVAVALGVGAWRANRAVRSYEAERTAADAVLGATARCSAHARVASSPVLQQGGLRWDAWLDGVVCADAPVHWTGQATLYGGPPDLARGDRVDVVVSLGPPQRLWNVSGGDPRGADARRGIVRSGGAIDARIVGRAHGLHAFVDRLRARLRDRIERCYRPDLVPMVRALILGESDLPAEQDQAFRASGLSHLLAVSGMHLVLVLAFAVRTLEALLCRIESVAARFDTGRWVAAIGIPVAWFYADLAGAGGSTVRAAWMTTAALVARALGRRPDGVRAYGVSLVAMAASDPLVALDLSFALSAAATAGLLAFAEPLAARLEGWTPTGGAPVARAAATTLAASIPCMPILARFSPTVPLGGVLANLLAVPLGECAALPLCFIQVLLPWWPAAEKGCAMAVSGALVLVRGIARGFATPALTTDVPRPTSWQLAVLSVLLAALVLRLRARRAIVSAGLGAILTLEVVLRRASCPRDLLRITFLDVGQGDAALLDLPSGEAVLIDGGGLVGSPIDIGTRVIAPELRARRRSALAAVILTHPHPDHFGGLATGLVAVTIGALWDTGEGEREATGGGYAALLGEARARGVPILRPHDLCGARVLGGARFEVLAPCPDFSSDRTPNDNSLVMRVSYGDRSVLFVGDAEREEEALLLASHRGELRADVLKVGHHGSRTSSAPEFLAAVQPGEAIVSVGCRNRYGHPSPETVGALAGAGIRVWRTDHDGAVTVSTDGRSLDVQSARGTP